MTGRPNHVIALFLCLFCCTLSGQYNITGTVLDAENNPIIDVYVQADEGLDDYTDRKGNFSLLNLKSGNYTLTFSLEDGTTLLEKLVEVSDEDLDLGTVSVDMAASLENGGFGVISLDAEELETFDDEDNQVSSILTAGRDVIGNVAAYTLSGGRFRLRGYNNEHAEVALNGIVMNDLDDGRVGWSYWSGLNDVLRSRQSELSLGYVPYTFGGVGGATNINLRPSSQREQTRVSYASSNRTYRNRVMVTHSSGMNEKGWAYTLSASRRWGNEGYIKGTYYDAYSYFASVEKKINANHSLSLVFFGTPTDRGRSSATTQDALDLAGSNFYNPNWGYQNGEIRNPRAYVSNQPIGILSHDWDISKNTSLTTSVMVQTGTFASTGIDWFNANDPRPDYYRKLPNFAESEETAAALTQYFLDNPDALQLDFDFMYEANAIDHSIIENANGTPGNTVEGRWSAFIVQEEHFDNNKIAFNSNLEHVLNDNISLSAGLYGKTDKVENYKIVKDLMGGDFYVNIDKFAERDFGGGSDEEQLDLNNPNRILGEGDEFGWKYDINNQEIGAWLQGLFSYDKIDFFVGAKLSNSQFWRTGHYRNGKFPESSFGDSEKQSFTNYALRGGLTYKLNGRNYLYANGMLQTKAPFSRNAYASPRTRDQLIDGLKEESIMSGELGYIARYPKLKARATVYYSQFEDQVYNRSLYFDRQNTFVNYTMTGVDKVHMGSEVGVEYKLTSTITLEAVAAIGDYYYSDRPLSNVYIDNAASRVYTDETTYIKNFKVAGSPQQAYSFGIDYNSPKFWFATLNVNYYDDIYLDIAPIRRISPALEGLYPEEVPGTFITPVPEVFNQIVQQEKLDAQITLDFFGGKSFKIGDYFIYLNLGVSNILDNKEFITGGFEQNRIANWETVEPTLKNAERFNAKYYYAYGRTYFASITFRM